MASGSLDKTIVEKFIEIGVKAFLSKPVTEEDFLA